jgi:hypothetical protein
MAKGTYVRAGSVRILNDSGKNVEAAALWQACAMHKLGKRMGRSHQGELLLKDPF